MAKLLRLLTLTLLLAACIAPAGAQNRNRNAAENPEQLGMRVRGRVSDANGNPLAGATLLVKGTSRGAIADQNGDYSIWAPEGSVISAHFLGYEPSEKRVERDVVNFTLQEDAKNIGEVVVTGYKTASIRETTGSVGVLSGEELNDAPMQNMDILLQGKLAGVSVQPTSGQPGSVAKIRIRGQNSITGNSEPLWVIDGVPLQKNVPRIASGNLKAGDFSSLFTTGVGGVNPNDIESITVLKDAASAAIYGSQAANGVIVVTTKRGKPGRMTVNYSGMVSVNFKPQRDANLMNSQEKLAWEQELWDEFSAEKFAYNLTEYEKAQQNPGYIPSLKTVPYIGAVGAIRGGLNQYAGLSREQQDAEIARLGEHTTDWFDALFRNSFSQSHDLSMSGGSERMTYYVSLGYMRNNGLVKQTNSERYSFRTQLNMTPNEKLSWGIIADMSVQSGLSPVGTDGIFKYAYFANPYERLYNDDGSYAADNTYHKMTYNNGGYDIMLPENGFNVMREVNETSTQALAVNANINANLRYTIFKDLVFSGLGAFSYSNDKSVADIAATTYSAFQDRPFEQYKNTSRLYGSNTIGISSTQSYILRGQFDYNKPLGRGHRIALIAGAELRGSSNEGINTKRYGYDKLTGIHQTPVFPNDGSDEISYEDYLSYRNVLDGNLSEIYTLDRFASFYAEADYFYKERYGVTLTGRTDGSNNFGSNKQFNLIWSLGAIWNIDREKFMKPVEEIITNLTLKVSAGVTGNVNRTVSPILIMRYGKFRESESGFYRTGSINNPPNPNLRWEKKNDMKIALSAGFIDRINFNLELYRTKGVDQVTSELVPYTTGYSSQKYNTSQQINQGVEFSLSTLNIKTEDFTWRTSFNIAWNQNVLTKYDTFGSATFTALAVGYPLNSIFGSRVIGINPADGLYDYQERPDSDGTTKSENYTFYLGTSNAPWNGGFHMSFSYKNLSLSVGSTFVLGAKIENNISAPQSYSSFRKSSGSYGTNSDFIQTQVMDLYTHHFNVRKDVVNRWTEGNPRSDANPRIIDVFGDAYDITLRPKGSGMERGILLESISYFKINSISLSYALPERAANAIRMQNVSFTLMVNNLFTFTNYSGLDPQSPGATYPQTRSMSFGVSLGF